MTASRTVSTCSFTAGWCPDCAFIKPAMPEIERDFADYQFIKVDRDENIDLAADLGIMGIPSFVAYKDGKKLAASSTRTARPRNRWKASYAVYKLMKIPSPLVVAGFIIICPPAGNMVHLGLVYLEK